MPMELPCPAILSPLISVVVIISVLRLVCSHCSLIYYVRRSWQRAGQCIKTYQCFTVPRYNPDSQQENALYSKVAAYIASLPTLEDSDSVSFFSAANRSNNGNEFKLHLGSGETVHDSFGDTHLTWTKPSDGEDRFVLRIGHQDRVRVLRRYLAHVEYEADKIESNRRELRLFTNNITNKDCESRWIQMPFTHPATFDTLVINPVLRKKVRVDLENFMKSRSYYHRLGRVWNRSYLLYGQSGTGKSSFAVAMARALRFDVCTIDMSRCSVDILETLLINTRARSLILLENLDQYLLGKIPASESTSINSVTNRLVSCCGDERIMVFTMTGDEDSVDHILLPLIRLDMHVYLPTCDFSAFRKLADRYLGVKDHNLFPTIEEGFQRGSQISPARVCDIMLAHREYPTQAIQIVLDAMGSTQISRAGSNSIVDVVDDKQTLAGEDVREEDGSKKDKSPSFTKICKLALQELTMQRTSKSS